MKYVSTAMIKLLVLCVAILCLSSCEVVPREKGYKNEQSLPVKVVENCVPSTSILPKFVSGKSPIYPVQRLMARQMGVSKVSMIVSKEGRVKDIRDIESSHKAFFNHTAAAMDDWLFEPAQNDGEAVEVKCQFKMTYSFK